ncbi:uncharacterized protein [Cicer arietinum]|uniref:Uncharacterized protein LOC101505739 n=1 Tax=Cicer arietinum TaxID=3827 RepID=A0A1S3DZ97_CICAR|nr:uncharacterized protein LOC101505739 [Cicer arietinum]
MANTLFGRRESEGVARQSELFFLWAITNQFAVNSGSFLARQFDKVAKASKGDIVIGGLITPIAISLGYTNDIFKLSQVQGHTRIDLDSCIAMKLITKLHDTYHLLLHDGSAIALPNPARTTIQNRDNWLLSGDNSGDDQPLLQLPPPFECNRPSSTHHGNSDLHTRMAAMETEQLC